MTLSQKITPINQEEEKKKFFFDPLYNPQFIYLEDVEPVEYLRYGAISDHMLPFAIKILDQVIKKYGSETAYIEAVEGKILTQEEVVTAVEEYEKKQSISPFLTLHFSKQYVSRTSMKGDEMHIRLPIDYRDRTFINVLDHEIGTHYLRRLNDRKQPWLENRKKYELTEFTETEEGLAIAHQFINNEEKLIWITSLYYYATYLAKTMSFSQMNKALVKYIDDLDRRWKLCLRIKRGLKDTSAPGGYSRNQLYFSGVFKVLSWLRNNDYNLPLLYLGKISVEDVSKAQKFAVTDNIYLPSFYTENIKGYKEKIDKVFKVNFM